MIKKIIKPWAVLADVSTRADIPVTGADIGRADYEYGYPAATMIDSPPFGQDMNGVLFDITDLLRLYSAGVIFKHDAVHSAAIGGYPVNALVIGDDDYSLWFNTVDGNTTNPNPSGAAGWVRLNGGSLQKVTKYGAGVFNFTAGAQTAFIIVEIVAGGGSTDGVPQTGTQSGISSAAGAGAYAKVLLNSNFPQTVTVGAGGVAGTAGAQSGINGGASSFGSIITCAGGNAGASSIIIADTEYPKSTPLTLDTALPTVTAGQILGISAGVGGESAIVIGAEIATSIRGGKSSFSGNAGDGGDGIYSYWNSPDKDGAAGFDGACIIYEFS